MKLSVFLVAAITAVIFTPSFAAAPIKPEVLDRSIQLGLMSCFKYAERESRKTNLLLAPGLSSCYGRAAKSWGDATSAALDRINVNPDLTCRKAFDAIYLEWEEYRVKILRLESVGGLGLNADDDIDLALRKHLYELAYRLSKSSPCAK